MTEKSMKYLEICVNDWRLLLQVDENIRVLQQYEFRITPGEFVSAVHMGNPLIDLGKVIDDIPSKKNYGIMLDNFPGILVDEIVNDDIAILKDYSLSELFPDKEFLLSEKCAKTSDSFLPILSIEKLFSVEFMVMIDEELSNRKWI